MSQKQKQPPGAVEPFDNIYVQVPKGTRELLIIEARSRGETLNEMIRRLLEKETGISLRGKSPRR